MAVLSLLTGFTYSFLFNFRDTLGVRTAVEPLPVVNFYTPQKELYHNQVALTTTSLVGQYQYNFFAPVGLTIGHWSALGIGLTQSTTIFSERQVFEVVDVGLEPAWLGLEELRTFLSIDDDDRTDDSNLQQALQAAVELVQGYTHRNYGERRYDEIIEVFSSDRVQLKNFPVTSIVGITAVYKTFPRNVHNLIIESLDSSQTSFYYRLDSANGILSLLDGAGYEMPYDGLLLSVAYNAGFVSVPEPVRSAALSIAAQIHKLSCTEGVEFLKFADISFATNKKIFDGHIGELLAYYRNNFKI